MLAQFNEYISDNVSAYKQERMDATWTAIGKHVDETGEAVYKDLAHVMLGILTIPHSSAHCERTEQISGPPCQTELCKTCW